MARRTAALGFQLAEILPFASVKSHQGFCQTPLRKIGSRTWLDCSSAALQSSRTSPAANHLLQFRHFSNAAQDEVNAAMSSLSPQERSAVSPGALMTTYPGPFLLPGSWFVKKAGWQQLLKRVITRINIWTALAWSKRYVPGFKTKPFLTAAIDMYKHISQALANGSLTDVDKMVTPALYLQLKSEIDMRRSAGWHRVDWKMVQEPSLADVKVVWGSLYRINPKAPVAWPQITVRIRSKQTFAAYDKAGRLVAGDPEQVLDVLDHWVFERKTLSDTKLFRAVDPPDAKWRLAARLTTRLPQQAPGR